jgi:hypothetical protein
LLCFLLTQSRVLGSLAMCPPCPQKHTFLLGPQWCQESMLGEEKPAAVTSGSLCCGAVGDCLSVLLSTAWSDCCLQPRPLARITKVSVGVVSGYLSN